MAPGSKSSTVASNAEASRVVGDRYRILEQVGAGGIGCVYRAEHLCTGRIVALKLLAPERIKQESVRTRFLAEARIATRIRHAHIVDVLDAGIDEDAHGRQQPFLAMEFVEGETLAQRLDREGPMAWPQIHQVLFEVGAALAHTHAHGIVHRDLKPENIMIAQTWSGPRIKVIDFGLARLLDRAHADAWPTSEGTLVGSPATLSPEQARGQSADERCDIYALGVIVYRCATGHYPYHASTMAEYLYAHLHLAPNPIVAAHLSADERNQVEAVVLPCLAKSPDDRPASIAELLQTLQPSGVPSRPPMEVQTGLGRRRRPTFQVSLGALVCALATLVSWPTTSGSSGPRLPDRRPDTKLETVRELQDFVATAPATPTALTVHPDVPMRPRVIHPPAKVPSVAPGQPPRPNEASEYSGRDVPPKSHETPAMVVTNPRDKTTRSARRSSRRRGHAKHNALVDPFHHRRTSDR